MLHRSHPTSVAFFDESGAISSDRFFTVGLLRVPDHSALLKQVKQLRKAHKYWEEFKWSSIKASNKTAVTDLIDLLLSSATFSCFVADRHTADPVARFGDTFAAYGKLATQLLIGSIRPYELVSVLADNYSAPNHISFETTVREECNRRLQRLAVVSVVQVDSGATEGLQLVDILTGAVAHSFRADCGLAKHNNLKGRVAAHLRAELGIVSLQQGHKSRDFGVRVYEHQSWLASQANVPQQPSPAHDLQSSQLDKS
ncbi:DUF3800 domain-containing protein [Micromonospora sp. DT178]|uniref:DUF3800 domain-containing protein n=1 Tax=Micromonospora sp. DT178 TaxID=3393436 RepID=UPI003CF486B4